MPHPDPSDPPVAPARRSGPAAWLSLIAALMVATVAAWAGAAWAVSGGGYQPSQQGCQASDSDFATPNGATYPGCHNLAVNVESGGSSQGVADSGNTRYVSLGNDQAPIDPNSKGTPGLLSIGLPGSTGSPHAGCLAVNTDGTNGGPAPAGTRPESPGKAQSSRYGCGTNPKGLGFEANYDYYQYYCPLARVLGLACEDTTPGTNTITPATGRAVNIEPILTRGVIVYLGADDNLDNGEHDGLGPYSARYGQKTDGAQNASSDGGAVTAALTPQDAAQTPTQKQIEGLFNLSGGGCADGICAEGTTRQQTVYQGCGAPDANGAAPCDAGTPSNANVYDYAPGGSPGNDPSVNSESANCNSGDAQSSSEAQCGPGGMDALRSATPANENAEPGIQIYTDPDPQRSPAAPAPFWPTPALYVGTCGVYAGSPATTGRILGTKPVSAAGIGVVNAAGQVAIDPNPSVC